MFDVILGTLSVLTAVCVRLLAAAHSPSRAVRSTSLLSRKQVPLRPYRRRKRSFFLSPAPQYYKDGENRKKSRVARYTNTSAGLSLRHGLCRAAAPLASVTFEPPRIVRTNRSPTKLSLFFEGPSVLDARTAPIIALCRSASGSRIAQRLDGTASPSRFAAPGSPLLDGPSFARRFERRCQVPALRTSAVAAERGSPAQSSSSSSTDAEGASGPGGPGGACPARTLPPAAPRRRPPLLVRRCSSWPPPRSKALPVKCLSPPSSEAVSFSERSDDASGGNDDGDVSPPFSSERPSTRNDDPSPPPSIHSSSTSSFAWPTLSSDDSSSDSSSSDRSGAVPESESRRQDGVVGSRVPTTDVAARPGVRAASAGPPGRPGSRSQTIRPCTTGSRSRRRSSYAFQPLILSESVLPSVAQLQLWRMQQQHWPYTRGGSLPTGLFLQDWQTSSRCSAEAVERVMLLRREQEYLENLLSAITAAWEALSSDVEGCGDLAAGVAAFGSEIKRCEDYVAKLHEKLNVLGESVTRRHNVQLPPLKSPPRSGNVTPASARGFLAAGCSSSSLGSRAETFYLRNRLKVLYAQWKSKVDEVETFLGRMTATFLPLSP